MMKGVMVIGRMVGLKGECMVDEWTTEGWMDG